jgi:predicted transcriptional regulator of viral defense system
MEFQKLLQIVGTEPVFETALLLAGDVDPTNVRRQLSRWTAAGRLHQLRRGVYSVASPYQKVKPHPFVVANALARGSYVSLQAALAHAGLIPEVTPVVTSVTTGRPGRWETALGVFEYRHVKASWLHGYRQLDLGAGQRAFVALPEKALLDLVHLQPGGDDPAYLAELRLQNLDRLDLGRLVALAGQSGSPKLRRSAQGIAALAHAERAEYETL